MARRHVKSAEVLPTSIDKNSKSKSRNPRHAPKVRCRSRQTEQVLKSALRLPTSALAADEAEGGRRRASTRRLLLDGDGGLEVCAAASCCDHRVWRQALRGDFGRGFNGRNLELPRTTNSQNSQESQNRRLDTLPHSYTTDLSGSSLAYEYNLTNTPRTTPTGLDRNGTETGQKWN